MPRQKSKKPAYKQNKSRKRRLFLPFPLLVFLMLCAGSFLVASTLHVNANDILVTARISGPLVGSPAVITSPVSGAHFTSIPISISGTCPTNAAYVEIFRNGLMSGSAICQADSTFQLSIDLFAGRNDLVAHVFNITDDEGPVSDIVTVYYDVPRSPPSSPQVNHPTSLLTLKTPFVYKGYYVGQEITWPVEISGGIAPYAINVDWGDGSNDVISKTKAGQFDIKHTYSNSGGYKGSYIIKIKATDSAGNSASIQFFIIINAQQNVGAGGNIFTKSPPRLGGSNWLWIAWPAYALVLILAISFWLGEREEILILRRQGRLRRS